MDEEIRKVRSELLAWAGRQTHGGLRRNALDIREALLTAAQTPERRARLMDFVTEFGERVAAKNS